MKPARNNGRITRKAAIALLALFFAGCKTNSGDSEGTTASVEIDVGGITRDYIVYSPGTLRGSKQEHPLVIVLHGGGGTSKQIMKETGERFFALAERDGFYVVFPNAVDKIWDFGAGKISSELEVRVDDRSYFKAVVDEVSADYPVDTNRVFATGISRGGQASYFLACQFPDRIRAIAPIAMPMPEFMLETCQDGPPIGVAIMNGTEDPLVPYNGGSITVGKKERDIVISTDDTVAFWNRRNGCNPSNVRTSTLDTARDRMQVQLSEWRDCSGAPVLLYRIEGGGHTWPSGSQYLPRFVIGRVNKDIDGADTAWAFFQEFD